MSEITLSIPVEAVKAFLLAIPTTDIRHYINGLHIETGPHGTALVATNGQYIVINRLPAVSEAPAAFTVPADTLKAILKIKPKATRFVDLTATLRPKVEGQESTVPLYDLKLDVMGNARHCVSIDGRFPDWRRVTRASYPEQGVPAQIDPECYGLMGKIAGAIAGKSSGHVRMQHDGERMVGVTFFDPTWFAGIMPMREDKQPARISDTTAFTAPC